MASRDGPVPGRVLVVGATGYVGTRLVPRLLRAGFSVRAVGRSRGKLAARPWASDPAVELVEADVADTDQLRRAAEGCRAAVYLVHSMGAPGFEARDRAAAESMARAAREAGLDRLVYLGGLGEDKDDLSPHLRSRQEVGDVLRSSGVPVTELRAGVILGSGSASFEILRYLVERLPVMVTPRWVSTPCQPIAIRNVLGYLVECLRTPETVGRVFEIGGPEVLTYRRLMEIYAEEAHLRKRLVVPVPVLTPHLSSLWIHLITPVPAQLARPLALGLRNPVIAHDAAIRALVPQDLLTPREAIRLAIDLAQVGAVESHWSDAGALPAAWSHPGDPPWTGGTILEDRRSIHVDATPHDAWQPLVRIGGSTGWYYGNWLWRARGGLDRLFGGVGMRRGRRDAHHLHPGDALDFWRVLDVDPDRALRLSAEMRLPGKALLEFHLDPEGGGTRLTQTARFVPHGLAGLAYWYAVYPLHALVFRGMLKGIGEAAAR